ncbi:uncharacterized protein LOC143905532 [Temnothorax americanus]|uniref:uncharacterized protein LOC143905532 n=1 Tax=Temnothorax americanus TaxID=1964332 RepID=UPI0040677B8E
MWSSRVYCIMKIQLSSISLNIVLCGPSNKGYADTGSGTGTYRVKAVRTLKLETLSFKMVQVICTKHASKWAKFVSQSELWLKCAATGTFTLNSTMTIEVFK